MAAIRTASFGLFARNACVAGPSRVPLAGHPARTVEWTRPVRSLTTTTSVSSGHNRWSKIRHRKGAADAAKSARLSRLCNEIYRTLKPPNSHDPAVNTRLAVALERGKEGGVTKAHVEHVMAKARSVAEGTGKDMMYEALGPEGREALIIQCVSDNSNRTIQGLNKVLQRHKYRMAPVAFMFEKKGLITIDPSKSSRTFDELFEAAVEAGAEDVQETEGEEGPEWAVYTQLSDLNTVTTHLSAPPLDKELAIIQSEPAYVPTDPLEISEDGMGLSEEQADIMMQVSEALEEDSDVVKVWTNLA